MSAVNAVPSDSSNLAALLSAVASSAPSSGAQDSAGGVSFSDLLNSVTSQSPVTDPTNALMSQLLTEFATPAPSAPDNTSSGAFDVAGSTGLAGLLAGGGA